MTLEGPVIKTGRKYLMLLPQQRTAEFKDCIACTVQISGCLNAHLGRSASMGVKAEQFLSFLEGCMSVCSNKKSKCFGILGIKVSSR